MNTLTQEQVEKIARETCGNTGWSPTKADVAFANAAFALGVAQEREANKRPPLAYAEIKITAGESLITHLLTKEEYYQSGGVALIAAAERCASALVSKEIT